MNGFAQVEHADIYLDLSGNSPGSNARTVFEQNQAFPLLDPHASLRAQREQTPQWDDPGNLIKIDIRKRLRTVWT
jgi:hypothetical protein